jgi:dihydrofolate synthase / folylpolyglutamate synthase
MKIHDYEQSLKYLDSLIGNVVFDVKSMKDPLGRMRILLELLGNPQDKFKSILIGGTSGKGSTAYLISHILKTAGYKTGMTISPHLEKLNERIQINGISISDKKFAELFSSTVQTVELMKSRKVGMPSYFEILIAMAFKHFAEQKVDMAVVEVGMGGEFDATNTLNPLIAVLTNVGLDHTDILGKTVEEIAKTKSGIIKSSGLRAQGSGLVVSGVRQPSVIKIVEDRCKETGSRLFLLNRDFGYKVKKSDSKGSVFDLIIYDGRRTKLNNLNLSLLGEYQVENASLAIQTIRELTGFKLEVSEKDIRQALSTASFPGRFEIFNYTLDAKRYTLILDGAHNPEKMKAFLTSLKKFFPKQKLVFLVAFKEDKDIARMLDQITKVADVIIVTEFRAKTDTANASYDAFKLKAQSSKLRANKEVIVEKDSRKALRSALNYSIAQLSNYESIIVVTGSLYLVGEIRSML